MCGRFTLRTTRAFNEGPFGPFVTVGFSPSYNIAPTQRIYVIRREDKAPTLSPAVWGLTPPWAKDRKMVIANGKSETVMDKITFRGPFLKRRCLIAADGFFEWRQEGAKKLPVYFTLPGDAPFYFAGLWEPSEGEVPLRATLLTTSPHPVVQPVHDRMPVMLQGDTASAWLDDIADPAAHLALLTPWRGELLSRAVSPLVNSPRNNRAELLV